MPHVGWHRVSDIHLADTPADVAVTVMRDGAKVAEKTFQPKCQTSQPNGPACGPTCTNASAVLAW
ncbi:MAG: hypothetical protein EXR79_09470 [Myxococcales bacterium]|nr:hypothetical protein [Myxococcales bacterium]